MRFLGLKRAPKRPATRRITPWTGFCGVLVLGLGTVGIGNAAEVCVPDAISRPAPLPPAEDGTFPIELEADVVESVKENVISLRGNAQMKRGGQALFGDELTYYRETDEVEGKGNVITYTEFGDRIKSSAIKFQVETFIGEASDVDYRIAKRDQVPDDPELAYVNARGNAEKVYLEGHDVARLKNVVYTTCVEGNDDVLVSAKELTLDQATGQGLAKNVTVKFMKVPVFYAPILSFPISNKRKSGFLYPSFGGQGNSGFMFALPYYFNLAPNYDATLTPRVYTKRGVQIGGEFRYLTRTSQGYVYGEALPSDNEFGDDRGAFTYKHGQTFGTRWTGDVDVQWVSDDRYLDDFSNDIQISSATYLPEQASLNYNGRIWRVNGRLSSYLKVDDTISSFFEPYDRLPQLQARAVFPQRPAGFRFDFDSEVVNFLHDERVDGWRFDATPTVARPFENLWGYFTPKLSVRYTGYSLDNVVEGEPDSPSRTAPVFSADSGIFLERLTSWLGEPFINTLEPRVFYVYIPEVDQDDLPVFDTGASNLNNFGNIYRENRFFGRDRVGDTNQVTLALSSRMIEAETGREWMRLSVGQIFFLEDRTVNIDPDAVLTEDTSDLLAELRAELTNRLWTKGYVQWDNEADNVREGRAELSFRLEPRRYFDLQYQYSRDSREQIILAGQWRVLPRWHLIVDERYSLRDKKNLDTSIGLEYDGCCWRVRAFGQRRLDSDSEYRNAIIVELELTGLARIRSGI